MSLTNYPVSIDLLLKSIQAGVSRHEVLLTVCDTPSYLVDNGYPALPLVISGKTVDKVHFDHGITKGVLERLPVLLASPKAVYTSATAFDSAVVVTLELKGGEHIIVPIQRNRMIGRQSYNVVASVYTKPAEVEVRWRNTGLLLWEPTAPVVPPAPKSPQK